VLLLTLDTMILQLHKNAYIIIITIIIPQFHHRHSNYFATRSMLCLKMHQSIAAAWEFTTDPLSDLLTAISDPWLVFKKEMKRAKSRELERGGI